MTKILHLVHCVDTEGPLKETLYATFERVEAILGLTDKPTLSNLKLLQTASHPKLDAEKNELASLIFSEKLLSYNDSWEKIDSMLSEIMSKEYRGKYLDDFGEGWKFTWCCMDHVGFNYENPRHRDIGHHHVFDRYVAHIRDSSAGDEIGFHYHPISFKGDVNVPATNYLSHMPKIFEILARKIIDRDWFPSCYRPGFHTTRPDSNWFLEQYIPFEYANQREFFGNSTANQNDVGNGRFGYWENAPLSWVPYNPSHDDYQTPGNCRRLIARCMNVGTRHRLLTDQDIQLAFEQANDVGSAIISITNHDFRDMRDDIAASFERIRSYSSNFKDVRIKNSTGSEAMKEFVPNQEAIRCETFVSGNTIEITTDDKIFGPQPFLAIKTKFGQYYHDNLDIIEPFRRWRYTLDESTVPHELIQSLKIAFNQRNGNPQVHSILSDEI